MLDDYGFEVYEENDFPLAYLLTFRTFGTWLHGDARGPVGKNGKNIYGTPEIAPNVGLRNEMTSEMKQSSVILNKPREVVEVAIQDLCTRRGYVLRAVNARSNHVHSVVSAQMKPERIIVALKAYATKGLREEVLVSPETRVWSRGRSRRYLWKPKHVQAAIDYVLYSQGDMPFEPED